MNAPQKVNLNVKYKGTCHSQGKKSQLVTIYSKRLEAVEVCSEKEDSLMHALVTNQIATTMSVTNLNKSIKGDLQNMI